MRLGLLIGLISLIWMRESAACTCMGLPIEEQIDRAEHVFRARITSAEWTPTGPESGRVKANFEILAILKGDPSKLDGVHTTTGDDCGISIVMGWEYVFFVNAKGEAGLCGGTMPRNGMGLENSGGFFEFVRRYGLIAE